MRKLLDEGRSVHETTEEGESLLSLACSAGYYELAQVGAVCVRGESLLSLAYPGNVLYVVTHVDFVDEDLKQPSSEDTVD